MNGIYIAIVTILHISVSEAVTLTSTLIPTTSDSPKTSANSGESTNYTTVAAPGVAAIFLAAACGFCVFTGRRRVPISINNQKPNIVPQSVSNQTLVQIPLSNQQSGQTKEHPNTALHSQLPIEAAPFPTSLPTNFGNFSEASEGFTFSGTSGSNTFTGTSTGAIAVPGYLCLSWGVDFDLDLKKIKAGGLGSIFNGRIKNSSVIERFGCQQVVGKVINRSHSVSADETQRMFRLEVAIMSALKNSPHIVKLIGYCETPGLVILMKKYEMSISDFIKKYGIDVADRMGLKRYISISKKIGADICQGMTALHDYGILHLDLKPRNFECVICDFGLARIIGDRIVRTGLEMPESGGFTPRYVAPEIIRGVYNEPKIYTEADTKIDVYAYAICLYEMFSMTRAWAGLAPSEIRDAVIRKIRPEFPQNAIEMFGVSWIDLIQRCWSHHPSDRPSFKQIAQEINLYE